MCKLTFLGVFLLLILSSSAEVGDVDSDDLGPSGSESGVMSEPVHLLAILKIKPEYVEDFLPKMMNNANGARKMEGNQRFDVFRDPKEPNTFVLIQEYVDMAAFEAQQKSQHAQPCISMFDTWIQSPLEVRFLKAENVGKQ